MRKLLVVTLLVTLTSPAWALLEVGPIVGYRMNKAVSENSGSAGPVGDSGYQYGALMFWGFSEMLVLRTGLVMSDRTIRWKQPSAVGDYELKYTMNYLDVPINLQIWIPATSLYAFGGVIYAMKSNSSCSVTQNPVPGSTITCNDQFASSSNIVNLGVGYDLINVLAGHLAFEVQYEHGLSNINDQPGSNVSIFQRGSIAASAVLRVGI